MVHPLEYLFTSALVSAARLEQRLGNRLYGHGEATWAREGRMKPIVASEQSPFVVDSDAARAEKEKP